MSMREKIARAVFQEMYGHEAPDDMSGEFADMSKIGRSFAAADAALGALSEPTRAMENAAWDAHERYEESDEGAWLGPKSIFTAMIAAAKEGR